MSEFQVKVGWRYWELNRPEGRPDRKFTIIEIQWGGELVPWLKRKLGLMEDREYGDVVATVEYDEENGRKVRGMIAVLKLGGRDLPRILSEVGAC